MSTADPRRFSGPDLRDLTRDPEAFVRRRLADNGTGFNYLPRRWFERAIESYFEHARSAAAARATFLAAQPGLSGLTDWKRQHGLSMQRMLERFIETDQAAPTETLPLFGARTTLWGSASNDAGSGMAAGERQPLHRRGGRCSPDRYAIVR